MYLKCWREKASVEERGEEERGEEKRGRIGEGEEEDDDDEKEGTHFTVPMLMVIVALPYVSRCEAVALEA